MVPASKHKTYRNVPSCAVARRVWACSAKGLPSKPGYVQGKARKISEASCHGHVDCGAAVAAVAAVAVEVALWLFKCLKVRNLRPD